MGDAGHGAIMAFRRERLVALGGFDPVLGAGRRLAGAEDLDMFCRILDDGAHIVYDPSCVVHHVHTRADDAYTVLHTPPAVILNTLVYRKLQYDLDQDLVPVRHGRMMASPFTF